MHLVWKVLKTPSLRGASNICIGGVSWKCRGYLILSKKGGYLGIRYIKGMVKLVSAEWILVCWRTQCVFVWIVQSSTWTNFQDLKLDSLWKFQFQPSIFWIFTKCSGRPSCLNTLWSVAYKLFSPPADSIICLNSQHRDFVVFFPSFINIIKRF